MIQKTVVTSSSEQTSVIFGSFDVHVRRLEEEFGVEIINRASKTDVGDNIIVSGDDADAVSDAVYVLEYLKKMSAYNDSISDQLVDYAIGMISDGKKSELESFGDDCICITSRGKPIKAKTIGQKQYVESIKKNTIVLGVGPAGTGKTFLAVAMACKALREKKISRIVLTRPAVEAGEKLGFLPGDLQNKIDPYLRPLYDSLFEMMGSENYAKHLERGTIEIAPLAYMRGRTLDDSFIILDEAQNATPEQMKMFLTRLGFNSKAIVTGDLTQTDLPRGQRSGLSEAVKILENIDDIGIHYFTERDVVRHKLVQKIILAYEKYERTKTDNKNAQKFKYTKGKGQ